jgi:hypothetical protein
MSGSLRSALRHRPAGRRARNSGSPADGPFLALGLEARPDVTDDDVRAAWRRVAAATHPDRADGGDPERFAAAAAAYTTLRTRFGRGEALADLRAGSSGRPGAASARRRPGRAARPRAPGQSRAAGPRRLALRRPAGPALASAAGRLLVRVRRGRPGRLALRVLAAFLAGAAAAVVAGGQPAAPALITGAATWLVLTARHDLAPPVPDHGPPCIQLESHRDDHGAACPPAEGPRGL